MLAARRIAVFPSGLYAAPSYLAECGDPASPEDLEHRDAPRLLGRNGEALGWTLICGQRQWEGSRRRGRWPMRRTC